MGLTYSSQVSLNFWLPSQRSAALAARTTERHCLSALETLFTLAKSTGLSADRRNADPRHSLYVLAWIMRFESLADF
jgi:hypothetical protein